MKRLSGSTIVAPLTLLAIVAVWELAVVVFKPPPFILPAPSAIWVEFVDSFPSLLNHSWYTMQEAGLGFIVGSAVGLGLAVAMSVVPILRAAIYPIVIASQTTPKIALAPLFIVWFGFGLLPKVLIVALLAFFPVLINGIAGLDSSDRQQIDLLRSVNASRRDEYRHVRLPASIPYVFASFKMGLTLSVTGAIIAEWVSANQGLGFLLIFYNATLRTTQMFAVLLMLLLVATLGFLLIAAAEKLFSWEARLRVSTTSVTAREGTL